MRVERIGGATLYCGDASAILPTLPRHDACVTDPPYGIGADRAMHKAGGTKYGAALAAKRVYADTNWDDAPPSSELMKAVLSMGQHRIIFGGNYFELPPSRCWLVWDKKVNGEFADCELAWTNLDKPVRRIEWMWNGMLRKGGEERNDHPTQKPLGVMRWALGHLPTGCQTVIDPFAGSGTTGVAAIQLGLQFTGIERVPAYFEAMCRRIEAAQRQPDMFVSPAPKAHQEALF